MMRVRTILLMLLAFGAVACQRAAQAPPTPLQVVNVAVREFAFEPRQITVKPGRVRFMVVNRGGSEHEFVITGVREHGKHGREDLIRPGATYVLEVNLRAGRYEVVCNLPGHKEAGMTGTLVVAGGG